MSPSSRLRQTVNQILDRLPEDATIEELQYHLYERQKIEEGLRDIVAGRTIDDDEVGRRMQTWFDESERQPHPRAT